MRTASEIRRWAEEEDSSLRSDDRRLCRSGVILVDAEGCVLFFRNAFLVRKDDHYIIFSEHHSVEFQHKDEVRYCKQFKSIKAAERMTSLLLKTARGES